MITVACRPGKEGKQFGVPMEGAAFVGHVQQLLEDIQANMLDDARAFRDANIVDVKSYDELKTAIAEVNNSVIALRKLLDPYTVLRRK